MATKRALIIHNDEDIFRICSNVLCNQGFSIITAKTGMSAFEELSKTPFDLVVTSLGMKAKNGFTVLGMIRVLSPKTPLVVFTTDKSTVDCHFLPLLEPCAFISPSCSGEMFAACVKGPLIDGTNGRGRTREAL